MSASRWPCGPSRSGYEVVGFDVDADRVKRLDAGESSVEDVGDERLQAALDAGTLPPDVRSGPARGLRRGGDHGADAAHRGQPDLVLHRGRRPAALARALRPGATVVLESTTYPGTTEELVLPILEDGVGPGGRQRLPPRLQPRAHRSRQHRVDRSRTRPRSCRASTRRRSTRCKAFYDRLVETTVPVSSPKRGRADQAAREHVPPRQHRARQRAGDVRRTTSASTCGRRSTRRRPSRSGSCGSRPAPASAGTACRSTRPTCRGGCAERSGVPFRFVELANDVNDHMPDYVVRRLTVGAQRAPAGGQRAADPAARPGLQAQHRRRPRVAVATHRRPAGRPRRRGARRPIPTSTTATCPTGVTRVDATPELAAGRTAVVLLVDHDALRPRRHRRARRLPARHPPPRQRPRRRVPLARPKSHPARNDTTMMPPSTSHNG